MNPYLDQLEPYPFERLNALLEGLSPNPSRQPVALSLGEPKLPWSDEAHVVANRALYRPKFDAVFPVLQEALNVSRNLAR